MAEIIQGTRRNGQECQGKVKDSQTQRPEANKRTEQEESNRQTDRDTELDIEPAQTAKRVLWSQAKGKGNVHREGPGLLAYNECVPSSPSSSF